MAEPNVMIVEDEAIIARDLRGKLGQLGYNVTMVADNGEDAVRAANEVRPDIVLMDIMLGGGMDGIEAAGNMQSSLDVPVIYLTAFSDDLTVSRARHTRPYGYLLKPYDEKSLQISIDMALARHGADQALKKTARECRRCRTEQGEYLDMANRLLLREIGRRKLAEDRLGEAATAAGPKQKRR